MKILQKHLEIESFNGKSLQSLIVTFFETGHSDLT